MLPKDFLQFVNSTCTCDKTPTVPIIFFEIFLIVGTISLLFFLSKFKKNILKHYAITVVGVLIFEVFTAPMWVNSHLGPWAYVYRDVSWILTVGWSTLVLTTVVVFDITFKKYQEWKRFLLYILFLTPVVFILESIVVNLGIRSYSPEVQTIVNSSLITGLKVPIQGLYYVPVFMSLVIGFYKYWSFKIENKPILPVKNLNWVRSLLISVIAVVAFELMIEPMVNNLKLPSWSYFYRDLSFILTGIWVLIIWFSINLVNKLFIHFDLTKKFILYILLATIILLPLESWFILNGFRVYGPSAVQNFSGFSTPITGLPIEVAFAFPFYLAIIISFIRFWEIILENKEV